MSAGLRRVVVVRSVLAAASLALGMAPPMPAQQLRDASSTIDLPALPGPVLDQAMADVDGDGDQDLLVAVAMPGPVQGTIDRVLLARNDGSGVFAVDSAATPAVAMCGAFAVGDIDGDGDDDVIGAGLLLLNDGRGVFADASSSIPSTAVCSEPVLLDLEGDGDLDLALASAGTPLLALFTNDGTGHFTDVSSGRFPSSKARAAAFAAGDVDGDGDVDLVVYFPPVSRAGPALSLLTNDGTGVFTFDPTGLSLAADADDLVFGDVDQDGDLDLLVAMRDWPSYQISGGELLLVNDGTGVLGGGGAFGPSSRSVHAVAFVDVDGDQDLDIVSRGDPSSTGTDRVYRNDGALGFVDVTAQWLLPSNDATGAFAIGDQDGDGHDDVVVGGQRLQAWRSDGRRLWNVGTPRIATPYRYDSVAAGDVNGDGEVDLYVSADGSGNPIGGLWYAGDGFGGASFGGYGPGGSSGTALLDVDGDGDLDVVSAGTVMQLGLNDGRGSFHDVSGTHIVLGSQPTIVGFRAGDLDGDGAPDVVVEASDGLHELLNDGTGLFTDVTVTTLPAAIPPYARAALGDADGDGDADLYVSEGTAADELYRNDGRGTFTLAAGALPALPQGSARAAFGDLDGDGDADVVSCAATSGPCRVLENDGTGHFVDATATRLIGPGALQAPCVVLADLDADGDLDALFGERPGVSKRLYVNDGTGVLHDATALRVLEPAPPTGSGLPLCDVVVDDLDGDGDLDVWGGWIQQILINRHRQIEVSSARIGGRLQVRLSDRPGYAGAGDLGFVLLGAAPAASPVRLPGIGTLRLDAASVLAVGPLPVPAPAGVVSGAFPVPANPWLIGRELFLQGVVLDAGVSLTNAVRVLVRG